MGRAGVRVAASVAIVVLAACSAEPDAAVEETAARFYGAVARSDGSVACGLLAPRTRSELESSSGSDCDRAVLDEIGASGEPSEVVVSGDAARVRVGDDTAFLARLDGGWRVTAAGCARPAGAAPDRPYACALQGG